MSDDDEQFENADSGAADCTPAEAGSVKKGSILMIKGEPCKVIDVSKAKVGKHGAAKCHFVGTQIFNGRKYEMICPASAQLSEPIVDRAEYQVIDIAEDGYLSLMDSNNETREDISLPADDSALADRIKNAFEEAAGDVLVTVLKAVGKEQVIDTKTKT